MTIGKGRMRLDTNQLDSTKCRMADICIWNFAIIANDIGHKCMFWQNISSDESGAVWSNVLIFSHLKALFVSLSRYPPKHIIILSCDKFRSFTFD